MCPLPGLALAKTQKNSDNELKYDLSDPTIGVKCAPPPSKTLTSVCREVGPKVRFLYPNMPRSTKNCTLWPDLTEVYLNMCLVPLVV